MNPFLTLHPKAFFTSYPVDHFLYKQFTLKNCLDNYSKLKPILLAGMDDIDDNSYLRTLRTEIRSTYFQSVETLFEMIFALSVRGPVVNNVQMWYHLSTSNWRKNFKRISKIAEGDIAFLEQTVAAAPNLEMPLIQYIFFFAVEANIPAEIIRTSTDVIRKTIKVLASEFSDRGEYNAVKHSMRLLPLLKKWEIGAKDDPATKISFDLSNSMTFLQAKPDGTLIHRTKLFDTQRDFNMTFLTCRLISNIVRSRRAFFFREPVVFYTFAEEALTSASKRNVELDNLSISVTPIYEPSDRQPSGNADKPQNSGA